MSAECHVCGHDLVEGVPCLVCALVRQRDERGDLLRRAYDHAVLNRGYVTSALLDEIRAKGLGS